MIAWSIEAALASGCFDEVIVSTDDVEIADTARQLGASVPFMRPAELADDYTGTIPVVRHVVQALTDLGRMTEWVCCIYATAPFVRPDDIRLGFDMVADTCCDYAFTVTTYPFPIQRAIRITADGRVGMFFEEHFNTRSQDLEEAYHDAGQFYWGRRSAWMEGRTIFSPQSCPIVLPRYRVQDIDTEEDWIRAERMFEASRRSP